MPFSAVLFDFDGVLVDTEWTIYQAWHETFSTHGQDLPLSTYTRCIGSDFATWSPKLHLEELTGLTFDWDRMDADRQHRIVADLANEIPMPGVIDLLAHLQSRNLRRAVVSSSSHSWVDSWLEKLDLTPWFESTICRGDAPRIKPAPDLYLEAARRLQVDPAGCLVIEDSLNGVTAAEAAGMTVWIVPNRVTSGLAFPDRHRVFPSLGKIVAALKALPDAS